MRLRTLDQPAEIRGIGLHTGHPSTLRLLPRDQPGWLFRRADLSGQPEFEADIQNVQQTSWATTLGGTQGLLHCCEHVLSALAGMNITGCVIEVDSDEIPICDGSSLPFVEAIANSGSREVDISVCPYRVKHECWVSDGDSHVFAFPDDQFRVTSAVNYDHPLAPEQLFTLAIRPDVYATEVAPARTFALAEWIDQLRADGLIRGGSLDNALVVFPDRYSSPLRFSDEMARHKALDLIGDLTLLGRPVTGHFVAAKASHRLHVRLVRKLKSGDYLEDPERSRRVSVAEC